MCNYYYAFLWSRQDSYENEIPVRETASSIPWKLHWHRRTGKKSTCFSSRSWLYAVLWNPHDPWVSMWSRARISSLQGHAVAVHIHPPAIRLRWSADGPNPPQNQAHLLCCVSYILPEWLVGRLLWSLLVERVASSGHLVTNWVRINYYIDWSASYSSKCDDMPVRQLQVSAVLCSIVAEENATALCLGGA